jgi:uncharacterized protein
MRKWFHIPLVSCVLRVVGGMLLLGLGVSLVQAVVPSIAFPYTHVNELGFVWAVGRALLIAVVTLIVYSLYVRWTEKSRAGALARRDVVYFFAGTTVGAVMACVCVGAIAAAGVYVVNGVQESEQWTALIVRGLVLAISSAVFEELMLRGLMARIIDEKFGPYWALGVSSLFFGAIHLANPNATFWAGAAIAVQAGFMLAAAYLWTRSLGFVIGIHFAWNALQAGLFGGAVSGNKIDAIFVAKLTEPYWLSGGKFGYEGSVITTVVGFLLGVAFLVLARRTRVGSPRYSASSLHQPSK